MKTGKTAAGLIGALKRLFDEESFEGRANHVLDEVRLMNPERTVVLRSTDRELATVTALMGADALNADNTKVVTGMVGVALKKVKLTTFGLSFLKDIVSIFGNLGEDLVKIGYSKNFPLVVSGGKTTLLVAPRVEDEDDDEDIPDFDDEGDDTLNTMLDEDTTKEEVSLAPGDIPAGSRATTMGGDES